MKRVLAFVLAVTGIAAAPYSPARAATGPVTDCPLRNAPFSVDTPLIDILLCPAAKGVLEKFSLGRFSRPPPNIGTSPPSFAAIISLRDNGGANQLKPEDIARIDGELRALPVTSADKAARCARYDNEVPTFTLPKGKPALLLFEKINGFRDGPSVDAARRALIAMAARKGWTVVTTDKGGAFNAATLRRFDAVIWNNISGDVLTLAQRRAFQNWLTKGGAFVGVHGSAGDFIYDWKWYRDRLIGARFIGHPVGPQFQDARVVVNRSHPISRDLPADWVMKDEWYSFQSNPRTIGAQVIATLDEKSYSLNGPDERLRMGTDHPIAWTNCIGKGRMFYSAIGHRPETYSEPNYVKMLEAAIEWAAVSGKDACPRSK